MAQSVLVAGTGTDVGKTVLTALLLRFFSSRGVQAIPYKPVQTGSRFEGEDRHSPDVDTALAAAGDAMSSEARVRLSTYRFRDPCSPHLAAARESGLVLLDRLVHSFAALDAEHEAVVVETAGGILVPLSEEHLTIDLIQTLDLPVVVAATASLGTINHSLLTLQALEQASIRPLALVMFDTVPETPDYIANDNAAVVRYWGGTPVVGPIAYEPELDATDSAAWTRLDAAFAAGTSIWERLL